MRILVRNTRRCEVPEVIELLKACGLFYETEDTPAKLSKKLERDSDLMVVALVDDNIVGFVMASYDGWAAILWHYCVLPEFRKGTGIGAMLGREIVFRLKNRGADTVYGLVLPTNKRMLRLSKGLGFTEGGEVKIIQKNI